MMRKVPHRKHFLKKFITTSFFLVLMFSSFISQSSSYNIYPAIEEFSLEVYQEQESTIYFTNTATETQDFKIYSHRYNPEREKTIDERDFITIENREMSVEPNETAEIRYKINIPKDTLGGSYFSIIVIEGRGEKDLKPVSSIALNYGIGSLIAIHVMDDTNIAEVFLNQTEVELKYKRPLNPFNTEIEYSIKNKSKYTFLPRGQLIIASETERPIFYTINSDETKLYPEREFTFKFNHKGNYKDFLKNKKATARVGTQFSSHLRETQIDLPYFTQTLNAAIAIGIGTVLLTTVILITKKRGDKKASGMLKKKMTSES